MTELINQQSEREKSEFIPLQSAVSGDEAPPDELKTEVNGSLEDVFLPVESPVIFHEMLFPQLNDTFISYFFLGEKEFFERLQYLDEKGKVDSEPNFLNLTFEALFDIPVNEYGSNITNIAQASLSSGVSSISVAIRQNGLGTRGDFESNVTSNSRTIALNDSNNVLGPPPPTVNPIDPPITPAMQLTGLKSEVLNYQPAVLYIGNIFQGENFAYTNIVTGSDVSVTLTISGIGASFGPDGGNNANIFFAAPVQTGSSEDRDANQVLLTTAQGNTLTFYRATFDDHVLGDFVYTLSEPHLLANTPAANILMIEDERYFLDRFVYSLTTSANVVGVGDFIVVIQDDRPVANDRINPTPILESAIPVVGSQQLSTVNQLTGSLITPVTASQPSYFGANGGKVTNVTAADAVTSITASTITLTDTFGNKLVVNRTTGDYVYTLQAAFANTNNQPLIKMFHYELTDNNNNKADADLILIAQDDSPIATLKTNDANETTLFVNGVEQVSGNLLQDNSGFGISLFGADGPALVNNITVNGVNDGSDGLVDGILYAATSYGNILVYTSGSQMGDYVYTLDETKTVAVPDSQLTVTDVIDYVLEDSDGSTATAQLHIAIDLNQAPQANNDSYVTDEDSILTINAANGVLTNDTDPDLGDIKRVVAVNGQFSAVGQALPLSSGAVLTLNMDGSFDYDPNQAFEDLAQAEQVNDQFTYIMADAEGVGSQATVIITITGVNDAPFTQDEIVPIMENSPMIIVPFAGDDVDSDNDQANLVYDIVSGLDPNQGSVVNKGDGTFTYDPGSDFESLAQGETKTVSFTYQAQDVHGALSNIATVNIVVTGVNNAPVAANQTVAAVEDGPIVTVPFAGDDVDSDNNQADLVYDIVSGLAPNQGSVINNNNGTFSYNPGSDFQALAQGETTTVSFTYQAQDNHGALSNMATVSVVVTGVNDAPLAQDESIEITEDSPTVIVPFAGDDVDSDNDQTNLVYSILQDLSSNQGSVTNNNDGTFSYNPGNDFQYLGQGENTTVSFTYQAKDNQDALSNEGSVFITVNGLNDPPVAQNQFFSISEKSPLMVYALAGTDVDNGDQATLVYSPASGLKAQQGSAIVNSDGSFSFDPGSDFYYLATDESAKTDFTYQVTDRHGAASNVAIVEFTVNGVNDAPVAQEQTIYVREGDAPVTVAFAGDDIDSDDDQTSLVYSIVENAALNQGSVINNDNSTFTYSIDNDFQGLAQDETTLVSFTYQAQDKHDALSNIAKVNIVVSGINNAPVVQNQMVEVGEDSAIMVLFAGDDIDSDNNQANLVYSILQAPSQGTLINNNDGTFSYSPGGGFEYLAQGETVTIDFTYQAQDVHKALSNVGTVAITVIGVNNPPVVQNQALSVIEDEGAVSFVFAGDDVDSDNDQANLIYTIVQDLEGIQGKIINNNDGTFTFQLDNDFEYLAQGETTKLSFTYQAQDAHEALSNEGIVEITITGVNNPPQVENQSFTLSEKDPAIIGMLAGSDVDSDDQGHLTYLPLSGIGAGQGTAIVNSDGSFSFDPGSDFYHLAQGKSATVSFTYQAEDTHGALSNEGRVDITVTGVNDAPVAQIDESSTLAGVSVLVDVLANDEDIDDGDAENFSLTNVSIEGAAFNDQAVALSSATAVITDNQLNFDPGSDFNFLQPGEQAIVKVNYQMQDSGGLTSDSAAFIVIDSNEQLIDNQDFFHITQSNREVLGIKDIFINTDELDFSHLPETSQLLPSDAQAGKEENTYFNLEGAQSAWLSYSVPLEFTTGNDLMKAFQNFDIS